ncbi:putative RNA recognition motif domain, nucleotide-binding alpha-beta plait domain superfamily [Helianthus annuus]|uniref:RNA recognition motif domain, nucleotide-binding alpha-beta plait domain superfamily n=1 Tax=Helianthus annuus TaxID=4232 RepID=A0A9K3DF65_HELAN|nr:putative RNA recognition motif domain, nucleotide-binding alpha-beta plait domain superfamily [Helianthus annuus]KAJ0428049.1 putative RNA recognition motif domain, nucleotide-binding alpha-beta plait domain superfamily [Helianthus annuus]KAJ0446359.1 putative RNA recognition motif domain, nucleotide-binding alpha-beta plait domain superfamily [Helianthus annuus]
MEGSADSVTKFFVSYLPEGCSPWELSSFIQQYGEVTKSYVAKKRDKFGKRFDFISFKVVRDWKDLEKRINGTNMGGNKLKVDVARFAIEDNVIDREQERKRHPEGQGGGSKPQESMKLPAHRDFRSYRDVVTPMVAGSGLLGSENSAGSGKPEKVVKVKYDVKAFEDLHWKAVVRRTADLDTLIYFDRLHKIGKVKFTKIQYLGGLSILVSFGSIDEAESFLKNKELWGAWFSKLYLWEGQVLAVERIAWLRI